MANHSDNKAPSSALVSVRDQPPAVLPAVVLTDFVPFPGPVVPVLLDEGPRRDAILQAKSEGGFFVLVIFVFIISSPWNSFHYPLIR